MHVKPIALLATAAIAALTATGCAKDDRSSTSASAPAATSAGGLSAVSKLSGAAEGDVAHGKAIFKANCAMCHGATGIEGGVGPSLKNEKSRKKYAQTVAWIKDPQSPMPKLYPDQISAKDVADVAAFVESL